MNTKKNYFNQYQNIWINDFVDYKQTSNFTKFDFLQFVDNLSVNLTHNLPYEIKDYTETFLFFIWQSICFFSVFFCRYSVIKYHQSKSDLIFPLKFPISTKYICWFEKHIDKDEKTVIHDNPNDFIKTRDKYRLSWNLFTHEIYSSSYNNFWELTVNNNNYSFPW